MSPAKCTEILPEWLNGSFFRDIYEKREEQKGHELQLEVIEGGSVVSAGENFCAQMYRVKVQCDWDGKQQVDSFIVKAAKNTVEFLKEQDVFGVEFEMYRTAITSFEAMWEKIGEPVSFGPKCLKIVEEGETEILVMSDLKDEGFGMMDRLEGLNEEATLLVLDRVAKFHASSVAYKEQFGELTPLLMRKVMPKNACDMSIKFTLPKVEILAKAAEKWGMDKELVQAIRKWGDNMYSETVKVMDPETAPEDFQVLCHGDLWLNNMMFKTEKDTKKVEDVILIDFQLSYWNRPEGDLFYFLASSVIPEVMVNRFDFFLQYYHQKLIEAMQKLKVKSAGPSLKSFHMQLLKNSYILTKTLLGILPVILMDKSDALSIEDLLNQDKEKMAEVEKKMFTNSRYVNRIKQFLPFFYNRGILDSSPEGTNDLNGNKV